MPSKNIIQAKKNLCSDYAYLITIFIYFLCIIYKTVKAIQKKPLSISAFIRILEIFIFKTPSYPSLYLQANVGKLICKVHTGSETLALLFLKKKKSWNAVRTII